jgi:hypothetical protein
MNEQQILKTLMQNPIFKQALKELMLTDAKLANDLGVTTRPEPNVYVWCAEMHEVHGGIYYHPIIIPKTQAMTLETMMQVDNYAMMASENQFEAYDHEPMINMFRMVHPNIAVKMIAVPKKVYDDLLNSLTILVSNILIEAEKCFVHFDNIAAMTRVNADMMKVQLLASVFSQMTTISSCFDREMGVLDSTDHQYEDPNEDGCVDEDSDVIEIKCPYCPRVFEFNDENRCEATLVQCPDCDAVFDASCSIYCPTCGEKLTVIDDSIDYGVLECRCGHVIYLPDELAEDF